LRVKPHDEKLGAFQIFALIGYRITGREELPPCMPNRRDGKNAIFYPEIKKRSG
jgi:hypothetical protein